MRKTLEILQVGTSFKNVPGDQIFSQTRLTLTLETVVLPKIVGVCKLWSIWQKAIGTYYKPIGIAAIRDDNLILFGIPQRSMPISSRRCTIFDTDLDP